MARDSGSTATDALLGRVIAGKFRIDARVGSGAMGSVYKARHIALKKDVAIKVMRVHGATDRQYAMRFKREAKAASLLDHPNSIRLIDFGQEDDGLLYIAMEYLEGKNLKTIIDDEFPLSDERAVAILSQALAALAKAHEMAIVHRDLKPENIMILPGTDDEGQEIEHVKVCDFGVAKFMEEDPEPPPAPGSAGALRTASSATTTLTRKGMTVGTPAYMSPEQALGEETDARSDIYQIGVILFQMITRRLPFEATNTIKLMLKQVEEPPPDPLEMVPTVNPKLASIALKALRKKAERRYQSAREMRAELRRVVDPNAPSVEEYRKARTDPPPVRSKSTTVPPAAVAPAPRRSRVPTLVIVALALVLAALVVVAFLR